MPLYIDSSTGSQALDLAIARGVMPTSLGSQRLREQIAQELRRNSLFSARTTNARYLEALKGRIERLLQGGRDNDWPKIRLELKRELQRLLYTPQNGFPGDEALGIPPAQPGSLRDLSSDIRLNLILETQNGLMRGAAQKARGMDGSRARQFPCWELVRLASRSVPRGSPGSNSPGWKERWEVAGGPPESDDAGESRLIALKGDPIWAALGSSGLFKDALDVDHPPFAFHSGMGWREVHWTEAQKHGFTAPSPGNDDTPVVASIPAPRASASGLSPDTIAALKAKLRGIEERDGVLTMDSILGMGRKAA